MLYTVRTGAYVPPVREMLVESWERARSKAGGDGHKNVQVYCSMSGRSGGEGSGREGELEPEKWS